jgi:hypothetical protein
VTVFALGGVTRMEPPDSARDEGFIAAAGPLTSLALGGVSLGAAVLAHDVLHWTLPGAVLAWTAWANIVLAVFNLVPAAPLDGGRVLQAVIWRVRGDRDRAARIAGRCGQVAGALMVVGGWLEFVAGSAGGLWLALLGLFVSAAALAEVRRSVLFEALRGVRVADVMRPAVIGQDWQTVERVLAETVPQAGGQPLLPLTDFDGRPSGVVPVNTLMAVPVVRRSEIRVREVAAPLERCILAGREDRVTDLLDHAGRAAGGPILVLEEGHIIGMITSQDIVALTQRPRPSQRPPAAHGADHGQ